MCRNILSLKKAVDFLKCCDMRTQNIELKCFDILFQYFYATKYLLL